MVDRGDDDDSNSNEEDGGWTSAVKERKKTRPPPPVVSMSGANAAHEVEEGTIASRQWRLRWYITFATIEVVHNNQLFIPSNDDNNGG